jgi:hypothetical protein
MIQLIYASAAAVPFDEATLEALLRKARENNHRLGVTGLLLYDKGSFLQVLEGEEAVVRPLFDHICKDPRHSKATLLRLAEVEQRAFGEWSMGFVSERRFRLGAIPGYDDYLSRRGQGDTRGAEEAVQRVLVAFRDGRYRNAVR